MNKTLAISSVVIVLILIASVFFYNVQSDLFNKPTQEEKISDIVEGVECPVFSNDQEVYQKAINSYDVESCFCIKNVSLKDNCKRVALDLSLYNEAVSQVNPNLCKDIVSESRKNACLSITKSNTESLDKQNPELLADIYSSSGNTLLAADQYEKLLLNDPNNINYLVSLSLAYSNSGLKEQESGGDQTVFVQKALNATDKAKKIDPNNSDVYRAEAYAYEILPDYIKSLMSYEKAIEIDPNNVSAYAGRGHVNNLMGMVDVALADFKKAAELDVNNTDAFVYSNLCRLESTRTDMVSDAINNCMIVINSDTSSVVFKSEAYQILGTIYTQGGQFDKAEAYLTKAMSLTPNNANLYISFAKLYIKEGNYTKAESSSRESIQISPTKAFAYQTLSYSLYAQGEYNDAISASIKGLDLIAGDVSLLESDKNFARREFYYTLANIYNVTGDTVNELKYKQLGDDVVNAI